MLKNNDWRFILMRLSYAGCSKVSLVVGILLAALFLTAPFACAQQDFRDFLYQLSKDGEAFLYTECSEDAGKSILMITLMRETYDIWLTQVDHGWVIGGAHVVIKENGFQFIDPPGGAYTRAKLRRYVEELLKRPFELLMQNQTEKLGTSSPKSKCPTFKPDEK